jgi:hypothetical protein
MTVAGLVALTQAVIFRTIEDSDIQAPVTSEQPESPDL